MKPALDRVTTEPVPVDIGKPSRQAKPRRGPPSSTLEKIYKTSLIDTLASLVTMQQ
jgi:hypothetical protein